MNILFLFWSGVLGAIIGSFLNVVILRLPMGKTLGGRSSCPECGYGLGVLDLVPVISYIWLQGKCKNCKVKISKRYVLIELITAFLFVCGYRWVMPFDVNGYLELVRLWFTLSIFVVVFVVDLEHFLILDKVILPASIMILLLNVLLDFQTDTFIWHISSRVLGGLFASFLTSGFLWIIWSVSKGGWLGFGDVKLMWFLGQVMGFPLGIFGFFLSFMIGSFYSLPFLIFGKYSLASKLPLGSFLVVGGLVTIFWGEKLLSIYLRMVGL